MDALRFRPAPLAGIALTAVLAVPFPLPAPAAAEEAYMIPCGAPEFRQLDFWIGTWDLTWEGGSGTNVIDRLYGDCIVRETFDGGDLHGMSVSAWDPAAGLWKQTWVDDNGSYLDFTGGMEGDRMILSRVAHRPEGEVHQRMVFHDIAEDSLTWDWERSLDGGKSWELRWRIRYQRRK